MANREELAIIRGARAGKAEAQLQLGRLYLSGSQGLPKNLASAVYWLERAARQECAEAWMSLGAHIPLELARQQGLDILPWLEKAAQAGVARAGLVLAQLVLDDADAAPIWRDKAQAALRGAAAEGLAQAQWLLSQQARSAAAPRTAERRTPPALRREAGPAARDDLDRAHRQRWLRRAADNGAAEAQAALIEQYWESGQHAAYVERALPLARDIVHGAELSEQVGPREAALLSRCARVLEASGAGLPAEQLARFWELAALGRDKHAQMAVGLKLARMELDGSRRPSAGGTANFKKAIRWLSLAGEQGLAEAWYALSRIYIKPEFSQRDVAQAHHYLERAAELGYRPAQTEFGLHLWRARGDDAERAVRAANWLMKAAAQGCAQAEAMLERIAPVQEDGSWAELLPGHEHGRRHPLLVARLALAARFGLSRPEALLLDPRTADRGHCLVVDIGANYGRSKRRLILLRTAQDRHALDRILRAFDGADCGVDGPEGNYRQRLYRLKNLLAQAQPLPRPSPVQRFALAA